jgi:(p)ppGpp synthase/HD superfamily hydrolase
MAASWDQDEYTSAYLFAAGAHKGQPLKGSSDLPYIVHPSLVSMEVLGALQLEPGLDADLASQCALLHDVMEDTGTAFETIKVRFGERVASGVLALTKNKALPPSARMADCLVRIRRQPREVWMVKLADRITNLQPPPDDWDMKKVAEYRREANDMLEALGSASSFLANRLMVKIDEYGKDPVRKG